MVTDSRGGLTGADTADPPPTELVGRRLGEFVLRECIGEGGFGAVYRADQPLLGRQAVVKVLHQRLRDSDIVLQRFMREALLASRLEHPYAAHVYAFGVEREDGLAWIAMEKVSGTTLDAWLRQRGPLPLGELVPFFGHVAEVVQTAHDSGIVHRDLKPSNVMVIERAGRVLPKLLDFGIAKLVGDAVDPSTDVKPSNIDTLPAGSSTPSFDPRLTQANVTLGSPPYMSPEQWLEPLSVGPAADLYSLGIMAYEALTGRRPFSGSTTAELAYLHCNAPVPPLGEAFPPELDAVFARVLAKKAGDRPPTVLAFAAELGRSLTTPVTSEPRPRRAPWIVAGCAIVALAATAIVVVTRDDKPAALTPPPPPPTVVRSPPPASVATPAPVIDAPPVTSEAPPKPPAKTTKAHVTRTPAKKDADDLGADRL